MKSLSSIILLLVLSSPAWGQCPGGACPTSTPVKSTVSVLTKTIVKSVEVTKQRVVRRPLFRKLFQHR